MVMYFYIGSGISTLFLSLRLVFYFYAIISLEISITFPMSVSMLTRTLLLKRGIFGVIVYMFDIHLEAPLPHGSVLCENAKYCCDHCELLPCLAVRTCNRRSFPCVDEDSGSEEETLQYFSAVDPNYRSRRKKKLDSQNKNSQSFLSVLLSINHELMAVFTDVKVWLRSLL